MITDEDGKQLLPALYIGQVVDRVDPEQLDRVRVRIAGLMELSPWAWPLATGGGGSAQIGSHAVPQERAEVAIMFNQGDPNHPYYLAGHWGKPIDSDGVETTEIPGQNRDPLALLEDGSIDDSLEALPPKDSPDVIYHERKDYLVVIDEREGKSRFLVYHKKTGDQIEHDGVAFGWTIRGTTAVRIVSEGLVSIEGTSIQINNRKVADSPNPI